MREAFPAGLEATALRQAEMPAATSLAVLVDDAAAIYPVRIDPTFSDADWVNLGDGLGGGFGHIGVYALAVSDSDLFVGGTFTSAGGIGANSVAKWNGGNWSALGSGVSGELSLSGVGVYALAVSGSNLYVGGIFTKAGGQSANCVARWDGNSWSALGSGMGGAQFPSVVALAVSDTNLYAGGAFTTAGGMAANYIAKWDGNAWSALGLGMDNWVNALAVSGNNLYAGGLFETAGGVTAKHIANWNGSAWSALGSGVVELGSVFALATSGSDLYVGGWFMTAGGMPASNVAKWDGNAWSALGSGMNTIVSALVVSGTNLYAGGDFITAGNKPSARIAKANIGAARGRFSNMIHSPVAGFSCTFVDGSVGQPYRIQTSPSLAAGNWTDFTNFTYTVPVIINVPAAAATHQFFRAITP